jgi:RNA-directed DNA polymerase
MPDLILECSGRILREEGVGSSSASAMEGESSPEDKMLMEEVVESKNLMKAYRRVVRNKGAAGIDGMTVEN